MCGVSKAALIDEALELEGRILHAIGSATVGEWCRLELTMAQLKGVLVLGRKHELPVGGLARELSVGLPAASAVVDRLVEQGLVYRKEDPADRRRTLVRLSPGGEELLTNLRRGSREAFRGWLEQMQDGDLESLLRGLRAMAPLAGAWMQKGQGLHLSAGAR
jgi:MarR family transcriptional regulator, organic hydroperoxide resistance regulator